MSLPVRFCPFCGFKIPGDWDEPFCNFCGARVSLEENEEREEHAAEARSEEAAPDGGEPGGTGFVLWNRWGRRQGRAAKKNYSPERWTGRDYMELYSFEGLSASAEGGFSRISPLLLLVLNIFSLGLCSAFFTWRGLSILNVRTREEESIKYRTVYTWLLSYMVAFVLAVWSALEYRDVGGEFTSYIFLSYRPLLCLLYAVFGVIANRHLLWWMREAMTEQLLDECRSEQTSINRLIPSSPLWLWYVGFPYIQFYINRALRKGYLS